MVVDTKTKTYWIHRHYEWEFSVVPLYEHTFGVNRLIWSLKSLNFMRCSQKLHFGPMFCNGFKITLNEWFQSYIGKSTQFVIAVAKSGKPNFHRVSRRCRFVRSIISTIHICINRMKLTTFPVYCIMRMVKLNFNRIKCIFVWPNTFKNELSGNLLSFHISLW